MLKRFKWPIVGLVTFVVIYASLPFIIKWYVNRTLNRLDGYDGRVEDVDLHMWRGAYEIEGIEIVKENGKQPIPFFKAEEIDLSIEWKQLLNGALVGEIDFLKPQINFIGGAPAGKQQSGAEGNWVQTVKDLFPVRINRFTVQDGSVHYRDPYGKPEIDVYLNDVELTAKNLSNSEKLSKVLMADVVAQAKAMNHADLQVQMSFNPYNDKPTFDLNLSLKDLDLTQLNDLFKQYGGVDVEGGKFDIYMEIAADNGAFEGYMKPFIKDLNVMDIKKEDFTFPEVMKESLLELAGNIFENRKKDTVATQIPLTGRLGAPRVGYFSAFVVVVRHAFFKALAPGLTRSVNFKKLHEEKMKQEK